MFSSQLWAHTLWSWRGGGRTTGQYFSKYVRGSEIQESPPFPPALPLPHQNPNPLPKTLNPDLLLLFFFLFETLVPVLSTAGWLEKNAAPAFSSVPVLSFPMPVFHICAPHSSAGAVARLNLPHGGLRIACCRGLQSGLQSKRAWSPLLRQAREPSSAAWSHGERARSLRAAEGLRNRVKGGMLDGSREEEEEKVAEGERKSQEPQQSGTVNNRVVERRQRGGGSNGTPVGNPVLGLDLGILGSWWIRVSMVFPSLNSFTGTR